MLYKKVHRQHIREWRKGRKFKYNDRDEVCRIPFTAKPHIIEEFNILIEGWALICMYSPHLGKIVHKDRITWLD